MTPASLEGQTLGKYRVLEPLGRGGMARVYRAYHPQLDRYVAVKVLRSDLVEEGEFLSRFQREARAVAALRHPNIVQVFDFDVQGDVYYMVMELLEGDTLKMRLSDYRARGEKLLPGEAVRVLLDVLDGLAYAHSEGMVHRDIKSANILLTRNGQAVLADFGIARIVGGTRFTVRGALMGTLSYMAPEQGLKGESDIRSDIYSLGIVFYEMLTQRTPFEADTPLAILMKHLNDPLPLPCQIDPSIPAPFERVVLKALAKEREDRYQSAEEMAQALRDAAEEAGVDVPERISLPLSFSTQEAPLESVAVFSGTARERIADEEFAADDTDTSLGQRLAAEGAAGAHGLGEAGKDLLGAAGALAQVVVSRTAHALRQAAESAGSSSWGGEAVREPALAVERPVPETAAESVDEEADQARHRRRTEADSAGRDRERRGRVPRRGSVGRAILGAIMLLVIGNLCMVTIAVPTGDWQVYERGWPMQLFLASWGLCVIMYVASSIWMLIPVGPVFATTVIVTYCAFSGNWDHWSFLWLVEVWVAVASITISILLAGLKGLARFSARFMALLLSLACAIGILAVASLVGIGPPIDVLMGTILP